LLLFNPLSAMDAYMRSVKKLPAWTMDAYMRLSIR